jgi:alkaline phosphatase
LAIIDFFDFLMRFFLRIIIVLTILVTFAFSGCVRQKPVNLILFIGDGMGVAQVYASMTVSGDDMTFPFFPVTGFSRTHSANSYSTDSAAGGTALATGEKTNNRMISVRPDSTVLVTLLEHAKAGGRSTGIICTSSLTDATPASFAAHTPLRYNYRSIAGQYVNGAADIFIGGGRNYFTAETDSTGHRDESENIVTGLTDKGYDVVYTLEDFVDSESDRIAGLMSPEDMPRIFEGRDPQYLATATRKAIEVLSRNSKGFILLIEGSEVDDAGHSNDTGMLTQEILDMDRAVEVAYDYARQKNNTLIVVTADHETGGMSITGGDLARREVTGAFSITHHSGVMVPVFAFGPGSESFTGVHDNTELFHYFYNLLASGKRDK